MTAFIGDISPVIHLFSAIYRGETNSVHRGYKFSFSTYKATNSGESTPFISIGSVPILKGLWCFL